MDNLDDKYIEISAIRGSLGTVIRINWNSIESVTIIDDHQVDEYLQRRKLAVSEHRRIQTSMTEIENVSGRLASVKRDTDNYNPR